MNVNEVKDIPIKNLKLTDKNPRKIDKDQFAKLCQNLTDDPSFLQLRPVLAYEHEGELWVYAGNQRVRAAKKLGWKTIPCLVGPYNESEVQRRTVLDNIHHGAWDYDLLSSLYEPIDLLTLGFTEKELHIDLEESPLNNDEEEEKELCPECGQKLKKGK